MSEEIKLKPCPFCGSKHITLLEDLHDGSCEVQCRECLVSIRRYYNIEQRERAVKARNRRADKEREERKMSDWLWKDDEEYEVYLWNNAQMYNSEIDFQRNMLLLELNKNLHALTRIIAEANGYTPARRDKTCD